MSGRRDESLLLDDLVEACDRLIELGERVAPGHLGSDRETAEMVAWNLMVLGEAAKRVSERTRVRFGEIPWRRIAATRDRIAHQYEGIDWEVVAGIIATDLPLLAPGLSLARDELRAEYDAH